MAPTDSYPLPRIEYLYANLSGGKHFTKLDLANAYFAATASRGVETIPHHQYTPRTISQPSSIWRIVLPRHFSTYYGDSTTGSSERFRLP